MTRYTFDEIRQMAPAGHYMALRIGYAVALEEVMALPQAWIDHYLAAGLMPHDPTIRWAWSHSGWISWDRLTDDPQRVLAQAADHGLVHGLTVAVRDPDGARPLSFGSFARGDRPFLPHEIDAAQAYLTRAHRDLDPPGSLSLAEIETLRGIKEGKRIKQIAHEQGVTEGAVKQRLRNAKNKLGAQTSSQAAALVARHGVI